MDPLIADPYAIWLQYNSAVASSPSLPRPPPGLEDASAVAAAAASQYMSPLGNFWRELGTPPLAATHAAAVSPGPPPLTPQHPTGVLRPTTPEVLSPGFEAKSPAEVRTFCPQPRKAYVLPMLAAEGNALLEPSTSSSSTNLAEEESTLEGSAGRHSPADGKLPMSFDGRPVSALSGLSMRSTSAGSMGSAGAASVGSAFQCYRPTPSPDELSLLFGLDRLRLSRMEEVTEEASAPSTPHQSPPLPMTPSAPTPSPAPAGQRRRGRRGGGNNKAMAATTFDVLKDESAMVASPGDQKGARGGLRGDVVAAALVGSRAAKAASVESQRLSQATVVEMSTSQIGSNSLQRILLKGHPTVIKDVLDGIETALATIMCDAYGNYLCSAAFQSCSASQRQRMLQVASQSFCEIATNKWGTHALQGLISLVCTAEEEQLLTATLSRHLVELSGHQIGVHVVQRALSSLGSASADVVIAELIRNFSMLAQNPHGICVLKKGVALCRSPQLRAVMVDAMARQAIELVQGPCANYVVQAALDEWGIEACAPIVQAFAFGSCPRSPEQEIAGTHGEGAARRGRSCRF
eukprot:TRINITY_DN11588_c0_g1_i2.p1 TRINITY_DN11588_c0_g1~~TRINITY_DN11588_c0_g1_i2.p1  ORF type:complete len:577 (+),score=106.63 TRINITY_DN11588_c0_g1_i2:215-1945(+)